MLEEETMETKCYADVASEVIDGLKEEGHTVILATTFYDERPNSAGNTHASLVMKVIFDHARGGQQVRLVDYYPPDRVRWADFSEEELEALGLWCDGFIETDEDVED